MKSSMKMVFIIIIGAILIRGFYSLKIQEEKLYQPIEKKDQQFYTQTYSLDPNSMKTEKIKE